MLHHWRIRRGACTCDASSLLDHGETDSSAIACAPRFSPQDKIWFLGPTHPTWHLASLDTSKEDMATDRVHGTGDSGERDGGVGGGRGGGEWREIDPTLWRATKLSAEKVSQSKSALEGVQ